MNNGYTRFDSVGDTLPLDGVVEEAVAVIESHVEGCLGTAVFTREEILRGLLEIHRPKEASPFSLQPQDTVVRIGSKFGQRGKRRIQGANEAMLIPHLCRNKSRGIRCAAGGFEIADTEGDLRVHITRARLH